MRDGAAAVSFVTSDYRRYWTGSMATHMAFQMQTVVLGWYVLERTDSAFWVGMVAGAHGLPMLLLGAVVGTLADQAKRQTLIAVALGTAAVTLTGLAMMTALALDDPWHLVVVAMLLGSCFTLYAPARLALLPNLLPPGALLRASTVEYSSTRVVGFLGPALAGVLLDAAGVWRTLLFQVGVFLLAAAIFVRTGRGIVPLAPAPSGFRPLRGAIDALAYLRRDPPLFALFVLGAVTVPVGMAYLKLLPVLARDTLGAGAAALGTMVGVVSLGTALSGFVLAAVGDRYRKGRAVVWTALVHGLALIGLAASRDVATATVMLLVLGLLAGVFLTLTNVLLQSRTDDRVRGRVMALYGMVWGTVPLVTFVAGMVAERTGAAPVIAAMGTLCAAACVVTLLRGSALRSL